MMSDTWGLLPGPSHGPMISFANVSKEYEGYAVFKGLDLDIQAGEFVTVVGPSGCGKSTLVRLLIGYEYPTGGDIAVDGLHVPDMGPTVLQLYRRKLGIVFQDYKLLPKKTAFENVAFALEVCGEPDRLIRRRVPEVLETVGLSDKAANFPRELSGGEQQRIAIARALVHKPRLLIADEPTGNLDRDNSIAIMNLLLKINATGTTVLLTTHSDEMVAYVDKRLVVLDQGKVAYDGPTAKYAAKK